MANEFRVKNGIVIGSGYNDTSDSVAINYITSAGDFNDTEAATTVVTESGVKTYVDNEITTLSTDIGNVGNDLSTHTSDTNNPHSVTKAQVGLDQVDNTSDADKPISTATQTALDAKEDDLPKPTIDGEVLTGNIDGTKKWKNLIGGTNVVINKDNQDELVFSAIGGTTAGILSRAYMTGDTEDVGGTTFYKLQTNKGTIDDVTQQISISGSTGAPQTSFPISVIGLVHTEDHKIAKGSYNGQLTLATNSNVGDMRFVIKVFRASATDGSYDPVTDLIAEVDTGMIDFQRNNPTQLSFSAPVEQEWTITPSERVVYVVSGGATAGNHTITWYLGNLYNNYLDVPIQSTTDNVVNKSNVTGAMTSDALNQLQTDLGNKADKVSGATDGDFAALDSNGNLIDSGYVVDNAQTTNTNLWSANKISTEINGLTLQLVTDEGSITTNSITVNGADAEITLGNSTVDNLGVGSYNTAILSTTEGGAVGHLLYVNEGNNKPRANFFIDDVAGECGIWAKSSAGGIDYVQKNGDFESLRINSNGLATLPHTDIIDITNDKSIITKEYLEDSLESKEDILGSPTTDGQILSSLADGTRSWTDLPTDLTDLTQHSINELNDVDLTTNTPNVGDMLQWDGSNWIPFNIEYSKSITIAPPKDDDLFTMWITTSDKITITKIIGIAKSPTGSVPSVDVDVNNGNSGTITENITNITVTNSEVLSDTQVTISTTNVVDVDYVNITVYYTIG